MISQDSILYKRRLTREVSIGPVTIGGRNPIAVQTMTNTPTQDVEATYAQILRIVEAGCRLVRITTPTLKDVAACERIKSKLDRAGLSIGLIADVHFQPAVAIAALDVFDKVRINPGNFADKKLFRTIDYTDEQYRKELEHAEEHATPFVLKAKQLHRSIRIGANHGSLSDRILSRYGDTPKGMAISAIEFAQICAKHDVHDIVFSMKASNPIVMIEAYKELVRQMKDLAMDYPLHLGVTEAGGQEEGRMKSAIGIGTLLALGLGDTVRVSLTEPPEAEIPMAEALIEPYNRFIAKNTDNALFSKTIDLDPPAISYRPFVYRDKHIDRKHYPLVEVSAEQIDTGEPEADILKTRTGSNHKIFKTTSAIRLLSATHEDLPHLDPTTLSHYDGLEYLFDIQHTSLQNAFTAIERLQLKPDALFRFTICAPDLFLQHETDLSTIGTTLRDRPFFMLGFRGATLSNPVRRLIQSVKSLPPVSLELVSPLSGDNLLAAIGTELGSLLIDGIGDVVSIESSAKPAEPIHRLLFHLLQGCRRRMTRAEFISCPGCGRTLFDLETTQKRIKQKFGHLTNVKIAIMGCIVNGPGEMADADFGYVGGAPNRITLYYGREVVEKNIPEEEADQKLVELIKEKGRWTDPPKNV